MNRKNFIPLVGIAFAVAVISTWIFYGLVAGRYETAAKATARTVVVAKRTLEAGVTVSPDDLRSITWTGNDAPNGSFALPSQVAGGRLLAKVGENEPLTKGAIELTEGGLAGSGVPVGMRAVSLRASDSSGLMGILARGSYVDIQAVSRLRDGDVSVRTILERVPVLRLQKPGEDGLGKNEPAVVTVLVASAEADRLALADSGGKVRLALRNPSDTATSDALGGAGTKTISLAAPRVIVGATPSPSIQMEVSLVDAPAGAPGEPGIQIGDPRGLTVQASWKTVARSGGTAVIVDQRDGYRVRVALHPSHIGGGRVEALVEPEISWPAAGATEARRFSQTMSWTAGQQLLVRGLTKPDGGPAMLVISTRELRER